MIELNDNQVKVVDGGVLPALIPVAVAFGKGFAAGAAVGGGVVLVLDALNVID
jgi:class IIb bacteriocin, lactobin A/cerein 7B family